MLKTFLIFFLIFQSDNVLSLKRNLQESDDIIILHLNDVHCGVNDTIGYDGFLSYRNELSKTNPNIITVDVGDHIQGGTLGTISDGTAIINIMNKIGFDVSILGNHEFDYGIEQLSELEENITSRYISSNFCYKKNKTSIYAPYKIIEKGGKKIGFVGVLTPLTFSKTYLSTIKDSDGDAIYDFLADNDGQELYDRVQENVNKVREEGADYVILLSHIGMKVEQYTSEGLLSKIDNVDAVLDGHTHLIYNTTTKDKNSKDIHITQTGTKLQSIGKLTIKKDGTITSENIQDIPEPSDTTNSIKLTRGGKEIWVDKDMNNYINDLFNEYEDELNVVFGTSEYDLLIRPEGSMDSHSIYCRFQECTLGNLVTDSFKSVSNSEVAIVNGGAVRNNLKKGNLTRAQIMEVCPFYNNLITKKVSGQCILDALEFGVSRHPAASGGFLQVSGISYDMDTSLNSTVETDSQGQFLNVTGQRKISNVKINGEDIDPNRLYTITMSEFLSGGGDGYSMFAKFDVFNESLFTDTDALAYYINENLNGTIPAEYKDLQGRINMVNGSIPTTPSTPPTSTISPTPSSSGNDEPRNSFVFNARKKSNGLSAGGILAIILPLAVALISVAVIAIMCSKSKPPNQPVVDMTNTVDKFNINKI